MAISLDLGSSGATSDATIDDSSGYDPILSSGPAGGGSSQAGADSASDGSAVIEIGNSQSSSSTSEQAALVATYIDLDNEKDAALQVLCGVFRRAGSVAQWVVGSENAGGFFFFFFLVGTKRDLWIVNF